MELQTPPPVDLTRLKGILGSAKKIIEKEKNFTTGHIDARALNEDGIQEMQAEGYRAPATQPVAPAGGYDRETIMNSRLPESIKKAMIENPIAQPTMNHTFTLDDVNDLSDEKPMGLPRTPKTTPKAPARQQIQESTGMISVTKEQLTEMVENIVNERLLEFFTKSYNQRITEDTIKRTVNTLIKEGKIAPAKKRI